MNWTLVLTIKDGHRYYKDEKGRIALGGDDGRLPGYSEEGLLYLDPSRDVIVGGGEEHGNGLNASIPIVQPSDDPCAPRYEDHADGIDRQNPGPLGGLRVEPCDYWTGEHADDALLVAETFGLNVRFRGRLNRVVARLAGLRRDNADDPTWRSKAVRGPCGVCGGHGSTTVTGPCPRCDGSGVVEWFGGQRVRQPQYQGIGKRVIYHGTKETNVSHEHYDDDCGGDGECPDWQDEPECEAARAHDWTSEGCGGLDENPGVWSLGGTTHAYARRCRLCGMGEHETRYGSQRNPGQCDKRRYKEHEYPVDAEAQS